VKIDKDKQISLLENIGKPANLRLSKEAGVRQKADSEISDRVELSGKRDEVNRIKEKVKAAAPIDQEKVDAIKQSLKSETYNVKGELVARAMLKSQLFDEIL
jgi:flagellar biosynthesis anti-sigma factor FlgM